MKEVKIAYRCDYCGTRMDNPYVTIASKFKDVACPQIADFHYCYYCWINHISDYLTTNRQRSVNN